MGTLPPPRFSTGELKPDDVDFCYGSRDGQLWLILDRIFGLNLHFANNELAVSQRKEFLRSRQIGICDVVASAERLAPEASDLGMLNVQLRDLISILCQYPRIHTLLFTGGNSKNGPEYFFRKLLKTKGIVLKRIREEIPRIHEFSLPSQENGPGGNKETRLIRTVSLTAPSGAANRAVGSLPAYKSLKSKNPELSTLDFRAIQYSEFF